MMTRITVGSIALLSLLACVNVSTAPSPNVSVFSGTSPCAEFAKPFLAIPAAENCDRIKWQLSLYHSGKYALRREYGYHVDNRTYLSKDVTNFEGTWKTAKGGTNTPVLVQLNPNQPNALSFALIDQNLLHPLDTNQNLAIGDGGASYTLSRDQKSSVLTNGHHAALTEENLTTETVFTGRSPCQEMAQDLNHPVASDCFKLKWLLTLQRDPKTLIPTTYKLRGTLYYNDNNGTEHSREGKWKVIRGTKTNPNAVVYQLDAFGADGPISLLKADPNVLFFMRKDGSLLIGNEDFSYTLNRDANRGTRRETK